MNSIFEASNYIKNRRRVVKNAFDDFEVEMKSRTRYTNHEFEIILQDTKGREYKINDEPIRIEYKDVITEAMKLKIVSYDEYKTLIESLLISIISETI